MPQKRVTLSIDSDTYRRYREYCEERGIILSKQVELFIKRELRRLHVD